MKELHVLEWSKKQGFFHIQPLSTTLINNTRAFFNDKQLNDYHVIAVGTHREMSELADELRTELNSRMQDA